MIVYVNNEKRELKAIGNNGTEYTNELLSQYCAVRYNRELDRYQMDSDESYNWWNNIIFKLNEVSYLENELDGERRCQYDIYCDMYDFGDLERQTTMRLDFLNGRIEKVI